MKICVFGAGSIGGYLAGFIAKSGATVSVVARGAHLKAIQEKGLTVEHVAPVPPDCAAFLFYGIISVPRGAA